jgi:hypothetical protein
MFIIFAVCTLFFKNKKRFARIVPYLQSVKKMTEKKFSVNARKVVRCFLINEIIQPVGK